MQSLYRLLTLLIAGILGSVTVIVLAVTEKIAAEQLFSAECGRRPCPNQSRHATQACVPQGLGRTVKTDFVALRSSLPKNYLKASEPWEDVCYPVVKARANVGEGRAARGLLLFSALPAPERS